MGMRGKSLVLKKSLIMMCMALTNALWKLRPGIGGVAAARISRLPTWAHRLYRVRRILDALSPHKLRIADLGRCSEI